MLTRAWRGSITDLMRMRAINGRGWQVVGMIHDHFDGVKLLPDAEIISACHTAHVVNRDRVNLKNEINRKFGQTEEFKTWKPSTT